MPICDRCAEDLGIDADSPRYAFTAVVSPGEGFFVGRADEGTKGYTPIPELGLFRSYEAARKKANELNVSLGLTEEEAMWIVLDTIAGLSEREEN